jgi:hypothetical protein
MRSSPHSDSSNLRLAYGLHHKHPTHDLRYDPRISCSYFCDRKRGCCLCQSAGAHRARTPALVLLPPKTLTDSALVPV